MSRLDELIQQHCPDGVEYKPLWALTAWDKHFKGVDKSMQKRVIPYKYYLSTDFDKVERDYGTIPYIATGITDKKRFTTEELAKDYLAEGEIVCIPGGGTPNVKYYKGKFVTGDNRIATSLDRNILSNKFLYYWLQNNIKEISGFYRGSGIKHPSMKSVLELQIPIPPLPVQEEIVRILDTFTSLTAELTAELTARRKQYEYYRDALLITTQKRLPHGFDFATQNQPSQEQENRRFSESAWQYKTLGEIFDTRNGYTPSTSNSEFWDNGTIPWFVMEDIRENGRVLSESKQHITQTAVKKSGLFPANSIIVATSATIGEHALITTDFLCNQRFTCLSPKAEYKSKIDMKYMFYYAFKLDEFCKKNTTKSSFASVDMSKFYDFKFPLPPLEVQERIVNVLDNFDSICTDLKIGLPAEIEARQKQYGYYRDLLLNFDTIQNTPPPLLYKR